MVTVVGGRVVVVVLVVLVVLVVDVVLLVVELVVELVVLVVDVVVLLVVDVGAVLLMCDANVAIAGLSVKSKRQRPKFCSRSAVLVPPSRAAYQIIGPRYDHWSRALNAAFT